ncbi:MAG TPA: protein kinase [Chthoniobacteraceae bacterium]|jgi:serine/threonine-protein kinase|nr:protein kinase [Chthoniobacteraceae bacterium]
MELKVFSLSSKGPVRPKNEDYAGFWEPAEPDERQSRGSIAIIADGVGGHGRGDIASRLAVETAIHKFQECSPDMAAKAILRDIFFAANIALYDSGENESKATRMATTMNVCIFKGRDIHVGHVGDSRLYLVRQEEIKKLTQDHSMTGLQLKLRLMTEMEARGSHLRSMLTRSVGVEPIVRFDYKRVTVMQHDRYLQCTDGLYCFMNDGEIAEGVDRLNLDEVCPYLVNLAERRGADDNLTAQLVHVDRVTPLKKEKPLSILATPAQPAEITDQNELDPGQVVDGRFRIDSKISRSGMATIYKSFDLKENHPVALKIPHMQYESDIGFFSRFQREADIGRILNHPNILKFYEPGETQSRPYIVMELLEGRTLAQVLNEVKPFPVDDALAIAAKIADALQHMHEKGVVHRDLKPQNLMICKDGTLRIMDFGIARASDMRRLTFVGFTPAMGTPDYMAPEQVKGKRGDARTDIYSLGAMLYEMTTGVLPFEADNPFMVMNARVTGDPKAPRDINPAIPPEVEELILHAMERDPRKRIQTATEMKSQLEDLSLVKLTGRHNHLRVPKVLSTRLHQARLVILSASVPILAMGLLFLLAHCQHGHHR